MYLFFSRTPSSSFVNECYYPLYQSACASLA